MGSGYRKEVPARFQAWPKHSTVFPRLIGTFAEQTLAARYDADPSAAAAADIAVCVPAYANGREENLIERALEDDYLSRDPSPSKRASYIRRTMTKARDWAEC